MVLLNDVKNANKTTIIVHGVGSNQQNEMEQQIRKAVKNALNALESGAVPGYGTIYMMIANKIREAAISAKGKEAIAMEGVADVMESIYRTLAENSGNDAIDAVIMAKKLMAEGKLDAKPVIPAEQFLSIIKRSGESAISMLRTDEVLSAKPLGEDGFSTGSSKVVIYTSEGCPWCARTKQYLKSKGVSFKEINVSKNPAAVQDMIRVSGQTGTPVTVIKGQAVVGFDTARLDALLG